MREFKRSKTDFGWPEPTCPHGEIKTLTNLELADYIAACGSEFDGVPTHVREALVRLLLYNQAFLPPTRLEPYTAPQS
jgi:hypothetical protein